MYKVGTICIGQNFIVDTYRNGQECVIIKPLDKYGWFRNDGSEGCSFGYVVKWDDGKKTFQRPYNLRPKHEPGSWDDEVFDELGWRPGKETETTEMRITVDGIPAEEWQKRS